MNIFDLRERLVRDYGEFISGFLKIRDPRLNGFVRAELERVCCGRNHASP